MANAGERALAAATQLQKIGFVDFTVDLVKGVYQCITQASMEQLKAYADFVSKIAQTLEEYQAEVLGTDEQIAENVDDYITQVFNLRKEDFYVLNEDQKNGMREHFAGVSITVSSGSESNTKRFDDFVEDNNTISHEDLSALVIAKLKKDAKESYDLIKTVLKIGMQKVVVTNGEINTKLTFHVDASDSYSKSSQTYSQNSRSWGIGGSIGGTFGTIVGALSGGYSSRSLNVGVVNERSTAATNVNIDILGSVKIQFRTETFPSIDG